MPCKMYDVLSLDDFSKNEDFSQLSPYCITWCYKKKKKRAHEVGVGFSFEGLCLGHGNVQTLCRQMVFNQSNSCWCGEKDKIISSLLLTYSMLTAKSQANLFIPKLCGVSLSKQFSCREERSSIWILMKHWGACAVPSCAVMMSSCQHHRRNVPVSKTM